ncbi:hypothetical protein LOAG_09537, partial [Loa loa]
GLHLPGIKNIRGKKRKETVGDDCENVKGKNKFVLSIFTSTFGSILTFYTLSLGLALHFNAYYPTLSNEKGRENARCVVGPRIAMDDVSRAALFRIDHCRPFRGGHSERMVK